MSALPNPPPLPSLPQPLPHLNIMSHEENSNYALFRDCLSTTLLTVVESADNLEPKRRKRDKKTSTSKLPSTGSSNQTTSTDERYGNAEELADFIDYLASEIFQNLPAEIQGLDHRSWREDEKLQEQYSLPLTKESLAYLNLPATVVETLETYNLVGSDKLKALPSLPSSVESFLLPIFTSYLTSLITPPPATASTRDDVDACEICGRWWIPLGYHHLIPRFVHAKVVKRGWHTKEDLQNVAWLCGACHRFVHSFKGHEDLARDYYTVELLLETEEVQRFAAWVGKLRWKKK